MRVLVTWGSTRGGTEGIARIIGDTLRAEGLDVDLIAAARVPADQRFDAVIVGGALYSFRWHADARRFVRRHLRRLRTVPVWFFSSGPLDESAERQEVAPVTQARTLMDLVGAKGHTTFGGRLASDARGFPASAMAKKHAGDWRNPERIKAWATEIACALPTAVPGTPVDRPARSVPRLLFHGVTGWALCAVAMAGLLATLAPRGAVLLHALAAPLIFTAVAGHYFRPQGARDPLPTALTFAGIVALLDLVVVAGVIQRSLGLVTSIAGFWVPLVLLFLATWLTGEIMSMMPAVTDRRGPTPRGAAPAGAGGG